MHKKKCFVTLTYAPDKLPPLGSLCYRDFQLFMKRLRKARGNGVRFFMCGEYGEELQRPHYHALLFGCDFPDKVHHSKRGGIQLYKSKELESLWSHGFASIGEVNFRSAGYVARYSMKKVTGDPAQQHYQRVDPSTGEILQLTPEFGRMSLRPGIGFTWLAKFKSDVFPSGKVISNGRLAPAPRYYNIKWEAEEPDQAEALKMLKQLEAYQRRDDSTVDRLKVREEVTQARQKFKTRSLHEVRNRSHS